MRYLLPILLLLATGCAEQSFRGIPPDAEIEPFVQSFANAYGGTWPELVYIFEPLEDKAAQCELYDGAGGIISIDPKIWENLCDEQKKAVIWHELGHCVLGRDHVDPLEISYMIPNLTGCQFYEEHEEELGLEMFTP